MPSSPSELMDSRPHTHDVFEAAELAEVLSHYDLGVIRRIRPYHRGSRRAPKVRIDAEHGAYLLKRRAPGRSDVNRVAFAHRLQRHLANRDFPVAPLVETRSGLGTALERDGRMYELFGYVRGRREDQTPEAAAEAGRALGRMHRLLAEVTIDEAVTGGSFHAAPGARTALEQIPRMVQAADPSAEMSSVEKACAMLAAAYGRATERARATGIEDEPPAIVHGDWHPGNLLYQRDRVVGVLDFDTVRIEPRVMDVANAALQFSMSMTESVPLPEWPDSLEAPRIVALVRGYDEEAGRRLGTAERDAIPWLIAEALILEAIVPIAATGLFGRLSGAAFLDMVVRKIAWLSPRARRLAEHLGPRS